MATDRDFRVIIGGGGISGLILANALERAGVDYVLLEARDTIHPQVGASIGLFANGIRIIDQLGCFEQIEKDITPVVFHYSRNAQGKVFSTSDGPLVLAKRYNYPCTFLERETVLRILYENLKEKSRIKLQKRIKSVDHNRNEVIVMCEDGTAVSGDVLVGCDGVHSKVRHELWRLSHLEDPQWVDPKDKTLLSAEYQCLFGISKGIPGSGLLDGHSNVNYDEGFSTMILGSGGKLFWFMFKKMDKVYKTPDIPRYTREDAEAFAENAKDFHLTPNTTIADLWANRVSYTLVPTEEGQFKTWTWGRIACTGDGVHKMTPNMGAGGNCAIESAAAIANEIVKMREEAGKGRPSYEIVKKNLGNYQKIRETRVTAILGAANGLTRIQALNSLMDKFMALWVLPNGGDLFTNMNCDMITGATKLDFLQIPDRSVRGNMPFNPGQGLGQYESKRARAAKALPFLGITALAAYFMWGIALPPVLVRIGDIMQNGIRNNIGQSELIKPLHSFYGNEFMDGRLRGLVACFASLQFADVIAYWQSFSFIIDAGIVYAVVLIEGARRANILTWASLPILLGYNSQFFGIGILMALYCFVHYIQSPIENFRAKDMRLTNMGYTASILPVLIVAHYIPHSLAFSSYVDPETRHKWEWIWQIFPVVVSVLQFVLKKTVMPNTEPEDRVHKVDADMPTINFTILSLCAVSAATWIYTFAMAPASMFTIFVPNVAAAKTGDEYIRLFLQFDQIFSMSACFLWLLYLFSDLKKAGMFTGSLLSLILKGALTLVVAGPGVTLGLGFLWREHILATKWHKNAVVSSKIKQ